MILRTIKTHWIAILLSITVGGIYASHHFFIQKFFLNTRNAVYAPITTAEYYDEALLYGPRAHDTFAHFGVRGDFTLAEYPESPALFPMLNPLVLGGLGKLFGSMNTGLIASDIIFSALIFFVLYLLMQEIGIGMYGSLLFSTIFTISPMVGIALPPISSAHLDILKHTLFPFLTKSEALYFSHFDEPKLTFVFLAFFVYALTRALKRGNRTSVLIAGASFGVLFYTYLYDWATCVTALGLLGLWFLMVKDYRRLKTISTIVGIGILVSSYYWINFLMLKNMPQSHDIMARLGGEFSHHFRFATVWKSYARAAVLVSLLWIFLRNRAKEAVLAVSALLLSYVVVVNEQVITGFNVQPDHWYRVQFLPIALSVSLLIWYVFEKWGERKQRSTVACMMGICVIAYLFVTFGIGQYVYSKEHARNFMIPAPYADGLAWLNAHTDPGSVVGTFSIKENLDLELYTKNKIFLPFGLSTIAPDEEIWQRAIIMAKLWNVDLNQFGAMLRERGGANYLFGDQYGAHTFDANFLGYWWRIPDDMLAMRMKEYETLLRTKKPLATAYRLDYLFVDKEQFPSWKEPRASIPSLKKIFENERIMIFSVQ